MKTCGECWWMKRDEKPVEGRDGVCQNPCLLDPKNDFAPRLAATECCVANTPTKTYWRPKCH